MSLSGVTCINIVFATLVTLLMARMKCPVRVPLREMVRQPIVWMFAVHWVKTLAMSARIVVWETAHIDERLITICFSGFGSLIVSLSSLMPLRLLHHRATTAGTAHLNPPSRCKMCMRTVFFHLALITMGVALGANKTHLLDTILLSFRVLFFVNCSVELGALLGCLWLVRNAKRQEKFQSLRWHVAVSLYMRLGVAFSVVLKMSKAIPREAMETIHLWFMLSGMVGFFFLYRERARAAKELSIASRVHNAMIEWMAQPDNKPRPPPERSHVVVTINPLTDDGTSKVPSAFVVC